MDDLKKSYSMSTPLFSFPVLPLLLFLLSISSCTTSQESGDTPPNIVVILADDLGYADLGCYGATHIQTPHLDRMAAEGVRLTQFYNAGRCCPTRASLLTGLHPSQCGMGDMADNHFDYPGYEGYLTDRCVTIAEVLREAGYATYISGKWHVGTDTAYWPHRRGFERSFGLVNGASSYFDIRPYRDTSWFTDVTVRMYEDGRDYFPPREGFYMTDAFTDRAVRYIREHDPERPFFLYLPYTAPHWPLHAPQEEIAKYEDAFLDGWEALRRERFARQQELGVLPGQAGLTPIHENVAPWDSLDEAQRAEYARKMAVFAAMIDRMDQGIGRVMDQLEASGLIDRTVVIFLSDNGGDRSERVGLTSLRDKSGPVGSPRSFTTYGTGWANASNTPYRWFKSSMYYGGTASPLIVRWPAELPANSVGHAPAHVTDLMATCLDLAGAAYPDTFRGRPILPTAGISLLPLLRGESFPAARPLFWEHIGSRAMRQGSWKIVAQRNDTTWAMYNVAEDPVELHDLAGIYPERLQSMVADYEAWAQRMGVTDRKTLQAYRNPKPKLPVEEVLRLYERQE